MQFAAQFGAIRRAIRRATLTRLVPTQSLAYWKLPFAAAMSRPSLVEFVVLDLEPRDAKRHAAAKQRGGRDAWSLADATVARRADFGSNDRTFTTLTHLAAVLRVGDYVWGYCVEASPLGTDLPPDESARLPEVVLVKKSYSERRRRESGMRRRRTWRLRHLEKENETGVLRGRHLNTDHDDAEYEAFLQELEEDPTMRQQIALYRDEEAIAMNVDRAAKVTPAAASGAAASSSTPAAPAAAAPGLGDDDDDDDGPLDDDFPEVGLEELLDELTLGNPDADGADGASDAGGGEVEAPVTTIVGASTEAPVPGFVAAAAFGGERKGFVFRTGPNGLGYYPEAAAPVEEFKMPEGLKFHFT